MINIPGSGNHLVDMDDEFVVRKCECGNKAEKDSKWCSTCLLALEDI